MKGLIFNVVSCSFPCVMLPLDSCQVELEDADVVSLVNTLKLLSTAHLGEQDGVG